MLAAKHLEDFHNPEVMERVRIHPVREAETAELSIHSLVVRIPVLPDYDYLLPFSNLVELREIVTRMENGELRRDIVEIRRKELDRRAVDSDDLHLRPASTYPTADSPEWEKFDLEGGTWK